MLFFPVLGGESRPTTHTCQHPAQQKSRSRYQKQEIEGSVVTHEPVTVELVTVELVTVELVAVELVAVELCRPRVTHVTW